jgi:hypothetical protein
MFQNAGRIRLERCANTPPTPALLHSIRAAGTWAENDVSAALRTPSSAKRATSLGQVRPLKTRPVSTPKVRPSSVTSTVWAWPPKCSAASNKVTRSWRESSRAAASPAIPAPTTAIRFIARLRPGGRARRASNAEGRKESLSAPEGTREGGGRRRTPRGFQPAPPAGSATKTGSACPQRAQPRWSTAATAGCGHVEPL